MSTATIAAPTPTITFNATHRCDACGAQAYAQASRVREDNGVQELLFCMHHFALSEAKLTQEGWALVANPPEWY